MQIRTLYIDYGEFIVRRYDLLAVRDGLLHGHAAPAMSLGMAVIAILWLFPAARDPLFSLVGAGFASVGGGSASL
jgi:hypothetical protein